MAKRRLGLFSLCSMGLSAMAASAQTPYYIEHKTPCPPIVTSTAPLAPTPTATPPAAQTPTQETAQTPTPESTPSAPDLDLGGGLALGESTVALAMPGYIDNAMPMNRIRLRYDYGTNNPFPDRGEFFYPKCGCFTDPRAGNAFDPNAKGPPLPERSVDFQEAEFMAERLIGCRASVFVEAPFRFINPEVNSNETGFSDLKLGLKYALIATNNTYLTAQLRVSLPTGEGRRGLGNELVGYEPALLLTRQLGCRSFFHGEFRGWIPTEGSDFQADMIRYGVGYSFLAADSDNFSVLPIAELVGWTLLGGRKSDGQGNVLPANGDTIVNGKLGVRFGFGEKLPLGQNRSQLFVGYGHSLTGDRWYEEIVRVDYQINY
jgi:hypothetical protein